MSRNGKIPFLELTTPHLELEEELVSVFRSALKTAGFVGGPMVEDFEREFAQFCGVHFCVGVGSGTDALRFALIAAGVQPGDTVLTVPNTFIATTEAIFQAGARPDLVDVDETTHTLDADALRAYLDTQCIRDPRTRRVANKRTDSPVTAVIPVHLYGQSADMDPIRDVADEYGLLVIEDACQAHGAEYLSKKDGRWRKAGSMGHAAVFSFYPGKNLGACGEAGAITTHDESLAEHCRKLRDHGQAKKYFHAVEGYNGRLDAVQAGILRTKLRYLTKWNEQRRECARVYDELLADGAAAVTVPHVPAWSKPVYHLYVVRTGAREDLQRHLADAGIGTGIHYPVPLHLQLAYAKSGWSRGDFPVSEEVAAEILSLPMFPGLCPGSQRRVVDAIS